MAGTISLSMTQQLDKYGSLLAGGKLYFFAAGTTTPQSAYQDSGLTIVHPNPITLDAAGRIPPFFLADGQIKIRLTDKNGVSQVTADNLLVIGASSGGGGGGGVDPTTVFQTGDVMWLDVTGIRTGWVRDNGRTIGSATSGATERANPDCQFLYLYYWQNFTDAQCPVVGGRGLTASADWAANKAITTRDRRGKAAFGLDDMGNSVANVITANTPTVAGSGGGEEKHVLTSNENGPHTHTITDPQHSHFERVGTAGSAPNQVGTGSSNATPAEATIQTSPASTGITINTSGAGTAHNNMPPYDLGTWYRKL